MKLLRAIANLIAAYRRPRYHFLENGQSKLDYKSLYRAEKVAEHMAKKTGETFDAYQCPKCQGFHIGKRLKPGPFLQMVWERA